VENKNYTYVILINNINNANNKKHTCKKVKWILYVYKYIKVW